MYIFLFKYFIFVYIQHNKTKTKWIKEQKEAHKDFDSWFTTNFSVTNNVSDWVSIDTMLKIQHPGIETTNSWRQPRTELLNVIRNHPIYSKLLKPQKRSMGTINSTEHTILVQTSDKIYQIMRGIKIKYNENYNNNPINMHSNINGGNQHINNANNNNQNGNQNENNILPNNHNPNNTIPIVMQNQSNIISLTDIDEDYHWDEMDLDSPNNDIRILSQRDTNNFEILSPIPDFEQNVSKSVNKKRCGRYSNSSNKRRKRS